MPLRLVFDIETNGLLPNLNRIHCITMVNVEQPDMVCLYADVVEFGADGGSAYKGFVNGTIADGLELLEEADELIGHNIIKYDVPVIKKVTGIALTPKMYDTQVVAQLLYPAPYEMSAKIDMPNNLKIKHSLEAWGYRLGCHKGVYTDGWDEPNQAMYDYGKQDVVVTLKLYEYLCAKSQDPRSIELELSLTPILAKIESYGFRFDMSAAIELYCELVAKRKVLKDALTDVVKPYYKPGKVVTPARSITYTDVHRFSRVKDCPFTEVELIHFNPDSVQQRVHLFISKYNWVPVTFTKGKKTKVKQPKLDDEILSALPYPEAEPLSEYLAVQKRIKQLAEGAKAWFHFYRSFGDGQGGRIHGSYNQNGTISGRCSHYDPNIGQVPNANSVYGPECRKLFIASPGKVLVGCDAAALELRCLAGYLSVYDDGACINTVLTGNKELGTDLYSLVGKIVNVSRAVGKTLQLAWMYGAMDPKLGSIIDPTLSKAALAALGKQVRQQVERGVPGAAELIQAIEAALTKNGFLRGLDGRLLYPRQTRTAVNMLMQSAGGLITKKWITLLYHALIQAGHFYEKEWGFCAFVHDEVQIECNPEIADDIGQIAVRTIKEAGEFFNFPCPMDGEYKIGSNWCETH